MKRFSLLTLFFMSAVFACHEDEPVAPTDTIKIEGKEYRTVIIGSQVWTAVNYAGPGGVSRNASSKDPIYGKYYSKAELSSIAIPAGWRIPGKADFEKLAEHHGVDIPSTLGFTESIRKLTSITNWKHVNGTNASGFDAHPAGYIFGDSDAIDGDIAEFWTMEGYSFSIQEAGADLGSLRVAMYNSNNSPDYHFSVRFVKDK